VSPTLLDLPSVRRYLSRRFLCSVPTEEKRLALTFDDGPNRGNTPALLDLLAEKRVRATFFLLGRYIRGREDLVRRALDEGHEIGNHGTWHLPLPLLPRRLLHREIRRSEEQIVDITKHPTRFYRPALGWFSRRVVEDLRGFGYQPVIGNIHPQDSGRPGVEAIVGRVLRRVEPGSIVILHDGGWHPRVNRLQTVEAVGRLVDLLRDRGYRFQTLGGLVDG